MSVLINLGDVRLTRARLARLRAEIDAYCEAEGLQLAVLAVDTMRGHFDGKSENSGDDTEEFLARIRANAADPDMATLAFMAIQGIRSMELLNTQVLDHDKENALLDWLTGRLSS